jgi:hypothetical protein
MNMKLLGALGAIAILAGASLAFQLGAQPATQGNLIASRLGGAWTMDRALTARLDQQGMIPPYTVEFAQADDSVLKAILRDYPRLQSESIYMWGKASMDGDTSWFILTSFFGNASLVFFEPTPRGVVMDPEPVSINMAVSRFPAKDILFLGGDHPMKSAAAYVRMK